MFNSDKFRRSFSPIRPFLVCKSVQFRYGDVLGFLQLVTGLSQCSDYLWNLRYCDKYVFEFIACGLSAISDECMSEPLFESGDEWGSNNSIYVSVMSMF